MVKQFVEYTRVSTKSQDYGIDAQKLAINGYVTKVNGVVIASFTEKESGKKNNRIELTKAIAYCKQHNATLIVAKLDRLSRDLVFIMQLHNSKLDFVVVDNPNLNTLTIGIFATIAQHERETISNRVKEALVIAKLKGKIGGKPKGLKCSTKDKKLKSIGLKTHHKDRINNIISYLNKNASIHNSDISIMIKLLNSNGYKTRQGNEFTMRAIKNILKNKSN